MYRQFRVAAPALLTVAVSLLMAACGGGDGDNSSTTTGSTSTNPAPGGASATYRIGGAVSGLASGNKLTLLDNGADALAASVNGTFAFATPVASNAAYAVTAGTQPLWQWCSVANSSGTATADVTNIAVTCAAARAQVSTIAGSTTPGEVNATGTAAQFTSPAGITQDRAGNIYVTDLGSYTIRKITPAGVVSTFAGSGVNGNVNGVGTSASFNHPITLAVDANDNIYVADQYNNEIRKITPDGTVSTFVGPASGIVNPGGVAMDQNGVLYVSSIQTHQIFKVAAGAVTVLAGTGSVGSSDGAGAAASFNQPGGLAVDGSGNVYVADYANNEIRKISSTGVVSTLAGSLSPGYADGTGTAAAFNNPTAVTLDSSGALYVADWRNNRIRKISSAGVVSTLAGDGSAAAQDGIGLAASFNAPFGLVVDPAGNVFVSDMRNNEIRSIMPIQ